LSAIASYSLPGSAFGCCPISVYRLFSGSKFSASQTSGSIWLTVQTSRRASVCHAELWVQDLQGDRPIVF